MYDKIIEVVSKSPLMQGINDVKKILECFGARVMKYFKDEEIIGYGDKHAIIIVANGKANVISEDYAGNRNVINKLGAGGVYGVAFVYSGQEVSTRLVATEDCTVVILDEKRLHEPCELPCRDHTAFLYNAIKVVGNASVTFLERSEILSRRTIREKVLAYLSAQARKKGSNEFSIPFSRQELADYISTDRSALSGELSRMAKDGLINYKLNRFRINISR